MATAWMQTDWDSPESRFWTKFFTFTVQDLYSLRKTYRRTARAWIQSDNASPGSFIWICDLFNKDHATVKDRLLHQPCPPVLMGKGGMIREYRRLNQISQVDLAREIGCSPSTLSLFETGRKQFETLPLKCQTKITPLLIQFERQG